MSKKKEIVMSGIRPTGFLHLGNYFGALKNYVRMQDEYECFFMVADLHSLTTHPDTKELKQNVQRVLAENIACGIDPDRLHCIARVMFTKRPNYTYTSICSHIKASWKKQLRLKKKHGFNPRISMLAC